MPPVVMPMKPILITFRLALVSFLLVACASAPVHTPDSTALPVPNVPGGHLIQQAEQSMDIGDTDEALSLFSKYLRQYPAGPRADQALSRIGAIYAGMGTYDAALAFYQRLLTEFPASPLANEAHLAVIDLLTATHQPEAAVKRCEQLLASNPDMDLRRQLWQRLERIAENSGSSADAAVYTYMLYATAKDEEKELWTRRLTEIVGSLEPEAIESVWDRMNDRYARSLLMFRYAVLQVVAENYDEALDILVAFRQTYPTHAYVPEADQIIASLEQRLRFIPQTLGCLLPLSGPYKLYGQRVLNGIELALSLFQSGEQPLPARLLIEDSAADDSMSIKGVRRLVDAGAGAIVGPIVSAPAAAREAQRLNIPMITLTQKPDITATGDFIFRHFITPQSQVKALVSYFINGVGLRDFGVLYPDEAYGQTFMQIFLDEVARQGGRLLAIESYDTRQTDFAESIRKLVGIHRQIPKELERRSVVCLKDAPYFETHADATRTLEELLPDPMTRLTGLFFQDPDQDRARGPAIGRKQEQETFNPIVDFDVLFIPDAPKTAGLILPQLAYHDIKDVYWAGTNLWHSPQLLEMSRQYAQNAVMADGFFKDGASPIVRQFVSEYQKIYNSEPGIIEAFAFDTAWILLNAMAQPEMQFRHTLRDSLLQLYETDGVTGPTAFDENGEAVKNLSLLRVKGDRFIEIRQ